MAKGKKKSRPYKPKPLLAEQGIIHLQNSFVPPSEESGLLHTVGGSGLRQALVLAPNYGYGMHMSDINQEEEEASSNNNENVSEEMETDSSTADSHEKREQQQSHPSQTEGNNMSVAQLVRSIGGATKDTPLTRMDVIEDDVPVSSEVVNEDTEKDDPASEEFYASLGMSKKVNKNEALTNGVNKKFEIINGQIVYLDEVEMEESPQEHGHASDATNAAKDTNIVDDSTQSIADYYKNYCKYFYSVQPDPLSAERIEFGQPIEVNEDSGEALDENLLNEARLAQINRLKLESSIIEKLKATENVMKGYLLDENDTYDPLPMEAVPCDATKQLDITPDTTLDQLWDYVKESPFEFNRWLYLIQYAEASKSELQNCRKVYSAFLPLFPYCFGYWKRYAEFEKNHYYRNRALTILDRALDFIPLSVDLWLSYISLFSELHVHEANYEYMVREIYEKALMAVGKTFTSDSLWESYIQWETYGKRMKRVLKLYGRLLKIPTRLYNRHWDNFQALIRDYHPRDILFKEDYERVRKKGCKQFRYRYVEEPEIEAGEIRKTTKPEDKLMDYIKTKLLERMTIVHEKCETETNQRWDYEDKIKRPYFHAKALDSRQLRNWFTYLDFEISEGDHDRCVLLFERCLIACAKYETFWYKYVRYLKKHYRATANADSSISSHIQKNYVDAEIVAEKEVLDEEKLLEDARYIIDFLITKVEAEEKEITNIQSVVNNILNTVVSVDDSVSVNNLLQQNDVSKDKIATSDSNCAGLSVDSIELPPKSDHNDLKKEETSKLISFLSVPALPKAAHQWQEIVRGVYKRACIVHCPDKPLLRLHWAAYEEQLGNVNEARKLITYVLQWFPEYLDAKLQHLELERRSGDSENTVKLFESYLARVKSKEEFTVISIKFARFLYKENGNADKALAVLRKALRRDKANPRLYSYVFDICYERFPSDKKGASAALELALLSKDLPESEKLHFLKKKVLFHQEHGDLVKYRDAADKLSEAQAAIYIETETARIKEEQEKWLILQQLQSMNTSTEVKLQQPFPVPSWEEQSTNNPHTPVPIQFDPVENGVANPNYVPIEERVEPDPVAPYKKVPPPEELVVVSSNYGYGGKHPEYKMAEQMAQKEYEQLEAKGYPQELKDKEGDVTSRAKLKRKSSDSPLFIIPPKGAFLANYLINKDDPDGPQRLVLEPPRALSEISSASPCVNVPDWFIKEGGELCISETRAGFSTIRYWPHFLNDVGNKKMFKAVRRCVKWHQKQIIVRDRLRWIPRLVSWLGPCSYSHTGLTMEKNEDWPPEILDLLHRLNQLTNHEFNSCSLNLYRTGHDSNAWHSDVHPGLGSNPPIASVSLGALRSFELRRKGPHQNFIRFPLFPGSLLLMEGATQADWVHQVPKEPLVKEERINMTFRVMHAYEELDLKDPKNILTGGNKQPLRPKESTDNKKTDNAKDTEVISEDNKPKGIKSGSNFILKKPAGPAVPEKTPTPKIIPFVRPVGSEIYEKPLSDNIVQPDKPAATFLVCDEPAGPAVPEKTPTCKITLTDESVDPLVPENTPRSIISPDKPADPIVTEKASTSSKISPRKKSTGPVVREKSPKRITLLPNPLAKTPANSGVEPEIAKLIPLITLE